MALCGCMATSTGLALGRLSSRHPLEMGLFCSLHLVFSGVTSPIGLDSLLALGLFPFGDLDWVCQNRSTPSPRLAQCGHTGSVNE